MKVIIKKRISVYGVIMDVELRQYDGYYQLYNVYPKEIYGFGACEEERCIPVTDKSTALGMFEDACGVKLTDEFKNYIL